MCPSHFVNQSANFIFGFHNLYAKFYFLHSNDAVAIFLRISHMGYGCLITQPSYTHNFPKTKTAINNRALLYSSFTIALSCESGRDVHICLHDINSTCFPFSEGVRHIHSITFYNSLLMVCKITREVK